MCIIRQNLRSKTFKKIISSGKKKNKKETFLIIHFRESMNMKKRYICSIFNTGSTTSDSAEAAGDSEEKQE